MTTRSFHRFLRLNNLTFACAESCTGGLLSRQMTAVAGSSDVFWGGVVTYSNHAKVTLLDVPHSTLGEAGAVSGPTALAMVNGLYQRSRVPLAVSITGVAGPGGGSPEKPVGTVWFGLAAVQGARGRATAVRVQLQGTRGRIQSQCTNLARQLAALWWESAMELDSLLSLTDNAGKAVVEASFPPSSFDPHPL